MSARAPPAITPRRRPARRPRRRRRTTDLARTRAQLRTNFPFYSRACLKVLDRGRLISFVLRPAQEKLWAVIEEQRRKGEPMGAVILKARKLGCSTMAQGMLLQRATLEPYHAAATIAHDTSTAGKLMEIAELMYQNLPDLSDPELDLKPPIANRRRQKEIRFGQPDDFRTGGRSYGAGQSSMTVDTAKEFEAARGSTLQSVHGSEVAFWLDLKRKLATMQSAVDHTNPNTLTLYESTANGHNEFKALCERAMSGDFELPLVFLAWFDDPRYRRPLTRGETFEVGHHAYGEEEPELLVRYALSDEQLNWRRWAIENLCQGDVAMFHQEYPSFPEEAFLATGQTVFSGILIQRALRDVNAIEPPQKASLEATQTTQRKTRRGTTTVPTAAKLVDGGPWEIWTPPQPGHQYVVGCDPATGEEDVHDGGASFAIQVIDHVSRAQVAQLETEIEPDLVAEQLLLICLFYSTPRAPWLAIERTGGYGLSLIDTLYHEFGYRQMYTRRKADAATGNYADRIGWDTNRQTKGMLHEEAMALLREATHGIQSVRMVRQMETYIRRGTGRTGPMPGARSDLLLAWMITQAVASEKAPRVERKKGPSRQHRVRYAVTGY